MSPEGIARDDDIGDLLSGVVRLVSGAVAAAYVPRLTTDSPVVWARFEDGDLASNLSSVAGAHLANGGPWGTVHGSAPRGGWTARVEPVLGFDEGSEPGPDALGAAEGAHEPIGALAVAFRSADVELSEQSRAAIALVARLCAGTTRATHRTVERAHQRRVDDLVSQISERLMSTTLPMLQENLDWTVETLCCFLGADAAFLRRNDHVAGVSILMAEYPRRDVPLESDPLGVVSFDADPMFRATRDLKVPLVLRDPTAADEQYAARVEEGTGGIGSFTGAGVPLVHADVTEGCLAFVYLSDLNWSEREVNALRAVAALLVQLLHRVDAEERLRRSASTDDLTGLSNRRALLAEVSARAKSPGKPLALLFLDLDRFKIMNDHLGHSAGDEVLKVIADRIRTSLRPADFAARLGGDEFVVLLEGTGGGLGAAAAAERLLEVISMPIDVRGQQVAHTGSIGIALAEGKETSGEELLGQADIALYAAKSRGRNQTVVFDEELEATVAHRSGTELQLRQALSDNAFTVLYQPEFDLTSGRLLAVEALVRWNRDGHGLISAGEFVSVAEEMHLITEIDRWVLNEACMQLAAWRRSFPGLDLVVRVNMSPAQLAVAGLVQTVTDSLRRSGLPPEVLCLEITEQAMIADIDQAVQVLEGVRSMGVKLAIDDFGTGFSSMVQLKSLPVDALKIDRVFVDGIAEDPTDQAIVDTVVRLARAFHLDVVAEGVETIADLRTLVRLGCRRAQGFLLARPLPVTEIEPILDRRGIDLASVQTVPSASGARR